MANHNSNRNSGITTKKAEPVSADRFVMIDGDTPKCASAGIFEPPRAAHSFQREDEGTSSDHIPSVGSCYIEIDSNMTATVKECGSNIVVFSYKQYPQASHSLSLERFINNFKFISTPLLNLSKDDHKKTYCRELPRTPHALQERKQYCTNLLKVALRYSDEQEIISLTREVESFIAQALNSQYRPGMNAAAYHAFRQFAMTGRK